MSRLLVAFLAGLVAFAMTIAFAPATAFAGTPAPLAQAHRAARTDRVMLSGGLGLACVELGNPASPSVPLHHRLP